MKKVLSLLLLMFSLSYAQVVAVLDGKSYTKEEIDSLFNQYWHTISYLAWGAPEGQEKEFLISFIRNKIIEEEAKKMRIKVSPDELYSYMKIKIGKTDVPPIVKSFIKAEILIDKISQRLLKNYEPTENELLGYYYLKLRDFKLPEQVDLLRVVVDDPAYENEIINDLKEGKIPKGKHITVMQPMWYSIQSLPQSVKESFDSFEIGSVSKPIHIETGYLILKVVNHHPPGLIPFKEAIPIVKRYYMEDKKQEVFRKWLSSIIKKHYVKLYLSAL